MIENSKSTIAQRREDAAVGNLGVIETGLPHRTRRGSSDSVASFDCRTNNSNSNSRIGPHAQRPQLRTNRRLSMTILLGRSQQEIAPVVEGRAKVIKCEVAGSTGTSRSNTINMPFSGERRTILHPTRVDIPPGSVTAIVGTAESGKSTLLKFLAGCMDSNMEYEGVVNLSGSTSYLPEETYLHRFYTPRTYIEHYDRMISARHVGIWCMNKKNYNSDQDNANATSTLPSSATNNTIRGSSKSRVPPYRSRRGSSAPSSLSANDIENLLDSLRIDRDRRDTVVGDAFKRGLNPGEQRRLELGLMVLASPDTLFCENPVMGLDSETSLHIMEFLKGYISNSNRRVIVTLDRPSLFVWNLIDNVILLSKGRIVYEGPRFDMESFFAFHKRPTPKRFSPLEHYLAVVSNFRRPDAAVNWESAFKQWQEEADADEGDYFADDIETCFPSAVPDVIIPRIHVRDRIKNGPSHIFEVICCCGGWGHKFMELLHRYLLNMISNPGILFLRLAMYTFLSLLLGALFYNLETDESYEAVNSRAALLFYSSSFYIFMVVSVLPFLAHDQNVRDKEILNGFYHPVTHHFALTVASIPSVLILALVITGILVGMVKLKNAFCFFIILTLALWCAESYSILMCYCTKNYIIAIVCLAGIFGISMPLEGFMLVPSKFPAWLHWSYQAPFHTYAWRSLMRNEFEDTPSGEAVLQSYEIENTNISYDMVVLFCYSLVIHLVCLGILLLGRTSRTMAQKTKES